MQQMFEGKVSTDPTKICGDMSFSIPHLHINTELISFGGSPLRRFFLHALQLFVLLLRSRCERQSFSCHLFRVFAVRHGNGRSKNGSGKFDLKGKPALTQRNLV